MGVGETDGTIDALSSANPVTAAPRIGVRPHLDLPWLLLPEGLPAQVLSDAAVARVPNTRGWFRGVTSQRGNLLPVFDLAGWTAADGAADTGTDVDLARQGGWVVAIGVGADAFALLCDQAPGLVYPVDDVGGARDESPLPERLAAYLAHAGIVSPANADSTQAYEFDVRRWLGTIAHDIMDID